MKDVTKRLIFFLLEDNKRNIIMTNKNIKAMRINTKVRNYNKNFN